MVRDPRVCLAAAGMAALLTGGSGCNAAAGLGGGGIIVVPVYSEVEPTCSDELTTTELAAQVVALGNIQRAEAGAAALVADATLTAVAEDYARTMATQGFIGHTDPEGNSVGDRVSNAGYEWIALAENLAYGPCTAERAIEGWMDSEGHRTNLLNPVYFETGVGVYRGGAYGMYWVQVFAARP